MRIIEILLLAMSASVTHGCRTTDAKAKLDSTVNANFQAGDMEYVKVCDRQNVCRNFSRLIMGTDHLAQGNWIKDGQREMTEDGN